MIYPWRTRTPRVLYKYIPYDGQYIGYVQSMLAERIIKYSDPSTFNDPFEVRPYLQFPEMSECEFRKAFIDFVQRNRPPSKDSPLLRELWKKGPDGFSLDALHEKLELVIREILRKHSRIYCLASTRRLILMWGHYARNHSGACIHFSGRHEPMLTAHAIKYTDEYPCLPFPFDSLPEKEFNQICATTKARGRSYEGEYRLLIAVGHSGPKDPNVNGDFVTLPEDSVIGVTAGAKMEPNNVSQLLAVAKAHKLPMWQAKIDNREFRLRFHRIL